MKKLIILPLLLFYFISFSQKYHYTGISVVSPNKDTLWLIDDPAGRLIAYSWDIQTYPREKKPIILFVESLPIMEEKNKKGYIMGN